MANSLVETLIGAVVLGVAGVFLVFAYSSAGGAPSHGYELSASFTQADGIVTGSDVRIAGIKVGTVTGMGLDPERYLARINFNIENEVCLPDDSQVKVASEGLLGGTYLSIEPGGNDACLEAGDEIVFTQGTIDLMGLISQAIFSMGSGSKGTNKKTE